MVQARRSDVWRVWEGAWGMWGSFFSMLNVGRAVLSWTLWRARILCPREESVSSVADRKKSVSVSELDIVPVDYCSWDLVAAVALER